MIIESIKEGFSITHRSWQVILVKLITAIINIICFFFFIGIPIAVAIIYMSIDISNIKDMIPNLLSLDPFELISRYLGLLVIFFVALTIYLTLVSVLLLYVYGGMMGVLKNAALNIKYRFSMSSFFHEARKLFFPLLMLFSLAFLLITGVLVVLGILVAIAFFTFNAFGDSETAFSTFVFSFFTLTAIFLSFIIGIASVIYTIYAAIVLVVENRGVSDAFKTAWNYLANNPMAFVFYIILILAIIAVNIIFFILGASFSLVPFYGDVMRIPYQLAVYALQIYLSIAMWSSLIMYYIKGTGHSVYTAAYDI